MEREEKRFQLRRETRLVPELVLKADPLVRISQSPISREIIQGVVLHLSFLKYLPINLYEFVYIGFLREYCPKISII
jgi:hypothetical protein